MVHFAPECSIKLGTCADNYYYNANANAADGNYYEADANYYEADADENYYDGN